MRPIPPPPGTGTRVGYVTNKGPICANCLNPAERTDQGLRRVLNSNEYRCIRCRKNFMSPSG